MNVNKVFICGRLTKKPELKSTSSGQKVSSFSMATSSVYIDKAGAKQENTEFHNIVAWGKTAETICVYMDKGSLMFVEGRLTTRSWDDKNGTKRYTTEIVCERVQFGPKPAGTTQKSAQNNVAQATQVEPNEEQQGYGEIPF